MPKFHGVSLSPLQTFARRSSDERRLGKHVAARLWCLSYISELYKILDLLRYLPRRSPVPGYPAVDRWVGTFHNQLRLQGLQSKHNVVGRTGFGGLLAGVDPQNKVTCTWA